MEWIGDVEGAICVEDLNNTRIYHWEHVPDFEVPDSKIAGGTKCIYITDMIYIYIYIYIYITGNFKR